MKPGKERILALLYIVLGTAVFFFASQIKYRFAVASEDVGPRFFSVLLRRRLRALRSGEIADLSRAGQGENIYR